jgi:hypothetical protein
MVLNTIFYICLMAWACAGLAHAQPTNASIPQQLGEPSSQPIIGPGVQHNIISIEKVMREIHQLMFQGLFTAKQATEVSNMMISLGVMMQEMSGPQGEKLAEKHEQELKEIRRRIELIKQQLKNSK